VVDAGFPHNTNLSFEDGRPVLRRREGTDRRPSAPAPEDAIHRWLPKRGLLDILARTAHLVGWPRHLEPASGSDPKIRDAMARYVLRIGRSAGVSHERVRRTLGTRNQRLDGGGFATFLVPDH
jgi:hypothetical protein